MLVINTVFVCIITLFPSTLPHNPHNTIVLDIPRTNVHTPIQGALSLRDDDHLDPPTLSTGSLEKLPLLMKVVGLIMIHETSRISTELTFLETPLLMHLVPPPLLPPPPPPPFPIPPPSPIHPRLRQGLLGLLSRRVVSAPPGPDFPGGHRPLAPPGESMPMTQNKT